jgi:hypothetical protein
MTQVSAPIDTQIVARSSARLNFQSKRDQATPKAVAGLRSAEQLTEARPSHTPRTTPRADDAGNFLIESSLDAPLRARFLGLRYLLAD